MSEPGRSPDPRAGVVITGVAAATSLGTDAESTWRGVLSGRCGMGPMPDVESTLPQESVGGQATGLPGEYYPHLPREARYLRWTVEHALRDAGVDAGKHYPASRRLAMLGTTLHGIRAGGRFLRSGNLAELNSLLAGETSRLTLDRLGIEGGALTTCSACSSSLGAVALGVTILESGQADLVIAGGYDAISEYAWAGFNSLRLIADGPLRPFCRGRQGMKIAEGYGIVVLERAESAGRRGAAVRARLAGWGESADSHHLTQPHPHGEGALAAMLQALGRAGVRAEDIGMVAAHATGTPDNDGAEYQALSKLMGDDLPRVPIVGFKSFLGHTLGGAGAVELVMSCMALRDQRVPACPNVDPADIEYPGLNVATGKSTEQTVSCTLNTSLGFGGANTCIVLTDGRREQGRHASGHSSVPGPSAWITGVGIVLPGAIGHAAFVERATRRDLSGRLGRAESIDDAELGDYLNARRARRLSEYVKFTLAAATMAVRDSRVAEDPQSLTTASAILGSMHGSASFCYDYYAQIIAEGALAANPVLFAEGVPNAAAAHLSATLGIKGACQTIIGSRTVGIDALALGALRVRSGAVDTVVVVAAEAACEIVDRAYKASGLQSCEATVASEQGQSGFRRGIGGVAFVVESSRAAAARSALPYASVLESTWASPHAPQRGGPAAAVKSALSRLSEPGRVIGSACNTWVDRAEQLGMRRAGLVGERGWMHDHFGELLSVSPLAALARELIGDPVEARCSILCTDWSGAASAVTIERLDRRLAIQ
ncbi:MAG: hypothetical protein H7Y88_12080 [Phycisphaerales bacterium]|nr:hypothetical protein [Phycisphaerales bacterium]